MKPELLLVISLIVLTSICDTISQLFLKHSINTLDFNITSISKVWQFLLKLIRMPRLLVSLLFSTCSLFIWLFVLSKADLNFAFSVDSMHYVFIALGSMIVLKERITPVRWLGIMSIVMGIVLVSIS